MKTRDFDYIEERLIAPCTSALCAYERLKTEGPTHLADRLMEAMKTFTDECRAIRAEFVATNKRGA